MTGPSGTVDTSSQVWTEASAMPRTLGRTLDAAAGFADVVGHLRGARRVVATGNGAAFYAALAMELAASEMPEAPDVRAVPAGLLSTGRFLWRDGDVPLAISSSGQQRDVIVGLDRAPRPHLTVTSAPDAPIGAAADARAVVHMEHHQAATHTQAYVGSVAVVLHLLGEVTSDDGLVRAIAATPDACHQGLDDALGWVADLDDEAVPAAVLCSGTGPAWAAALEAALLIKELAQVHAEGLEAREAATSGMYALSDQDAVLSLRTPDDPHATEVERVCARTGARVVRLPADEGRDRRLVAITSFPAALALALTFAQRRGLDVDAPAWADAYYATTRMRGDDEAT